MLLVVLSGVRVEISPSLLLDLIGVLQHPHETEQDWAQVLQAVKQSNSIQASSAESWCRH